MNILKFNVIVIAIVLFNSCRSTVSTPDIPTSEVLPTIVAQLRDEIQDMKPGEVYTAIVTRLGKESRNIGSGISILQWDLKDGYLIFHPFRGPSYYPKTGGVIWLLSTYNPARLNIIQQYEMTTLPDPNNYGTQYWLGNLSISQDMIYRFSSSDFNMKEHPDQLYNFFISNPVGSVELEWATGLNDETCLETIGNRTTANLTFHSEKNDATLRCAVNSSNDSRMIEIISPPFRMWASWLHFWRVE